jgi:hypothetical protein
VCVCSINTRNFRCISFIELCELFNLVKNVTLCITDVEKVSIVKMLVGHNCTDDMWSIKAITVYLFIF